MQLILKSRYLLLQLVHHDCVLLDALIYLLILSLRSLNLLNKLLLNPIQLLQLSITSLLNIVLAQRAIMPQKITGVLIQTHSGLHLTQLLLTLRYFLLFLFEISILVLVLLLKNPHLDLLVSQEVADSWTVFGLLFEHDPDDFHEFVAVLGWNAVEVSGADLVGQLEVGGGFEGGSQGC